MKLRSEGVKFFKFPFELIKVPGPTKLGHIHLPSIAHDQSDNSSLEVVLNLHGHNARDVLQDVLPNGRQNPLDLAEDTLDGGTRRLSGWS